MQRFMSIRKPGLICFTLLSVAFNSWAAPAKKTAGKPSASPAPVSRTLTKDVSKILVGDYDYDSSTISIAGIPFDGYGKLDDDIVTLDIRGWDRFEALLGINDAGYIEGCTQSILFEVDGVEVDTVRVDFSEKAKPIQIPLMGKKSLTMKRLGCGLIVLALPKISKGQPKPPPTAQIPILLSPENEDRVDMNAQLVWKQVRGASGYLIELQNVKLSDVSDEKNGKRFIVTQVAANQTTFNLEKGMPKGDWRWRVHALSRDGILGEMADWSRFSLV